MVRVPLKPFAYYLEGRLFEWSMTVSMILLSLEIYVWPNTLRASAFQWLSVVMSTEFIGVVLLFCGIFRVWALIANGTSPVVGPRLRSICALIGAVMWVQFGTALVKLSFEQGFASPGVPFWYTFTVAELYVTYRAVLDVRSPH